MGKGEIARYEQFLLFPQCFQKACFPGASKGVIVWEWVKVLADSMVTAMPLKSVKQKNTLWENKNVFGTSILSYSH